MSRVRVLGPVWSRRDVKDRLEVVPHLPWLTACTNVGGTLSLDSFPNRNRVHVQIRFNRHRGANIIKVGSYHDRFLTLSEMSRTDYRLVTTMMISSLYSSDRHLSKETDAYLAQLQVSQTFFTRWAQCFNHWAIKQCFNLEPYFLNFISYNKKATG